MAEHLLPAPGRSSIIAHVLQALGPYWRKMPDLIRELPISQTEFPPVHGPLRLHEISLPAWAASCGVSGNMLVPAECCAKGDDWRKVDWWLAAFLLLESWHERVHEKVHGPIHSYSFRLKDWDQRVWRYAWVNRIAMFLRIWGSRHHECDADDRIGRFPEPKVFMTHDVDAIRKTLPIRIKQGGFCLVNAARYSTAGEWSAAGQCVKRAARFLFGQEDWWLFDVLLRLEEEFGVRSLFNFYADQRRKSAVRWLFDPNYDVSSSRIRGLIKRLSSGGWKTGLHQLRFSWDSTWSAQEQAGLTEDLTLMFNDRMGFRNAAALSWHPWDTTYRRSRNLLATPTVLMDSHAYDYAGMDQDERRREFRHWLGEIRFVGGRAAVLWHPHTLAADYGWQAGYVDCMNIVSDLKL
jgi:hypothetical protein